MLHKLVYLMSAVAAAKGITIRTDWAEQTVVIPMDMDKLQQAFLNLIKNAIESISGEGTVTVSVRKGEKGWVVIRVSDTGCGMSTRKWSGYQPRIHDDEREGGGRSRVAPGP